MGLLQATIYDNNDFTNFVYTFAVPRLNLTFDENLHVFFIDRNEKYSMTIQGMIRVDYNNLYQFTIYSNKDVKIYLNEILRFSKPASILDN